MTQHILNFRFRTLLSIVFLVSISLLVYGYWLEIFEQLDPCPLCIFQRISFLALAVTGLVGSLHNPSVPVCRVYGCLGAIFSLIGTLIAARHLWLQSLPPDQVPECGPGLEYLIEMLSFTDILKKVFSFTFLNCIT